MRPSTRKLVASLDLRSFVDAPRAGAIGQGHSFAETIQLLAVLFPAARCILLGRGSGYGPADLTHLLKPGDFPEDGSVSMPLLLDMSLCGLPLPNNFFHSPYWRQVAYLDMSNLPGSLQGIVKAETFQGALPNLRILKIRGRGLDEQSISPIAGFLRQRVWSLDLRDNKLTDRCVDSFLYGCFGADYLTVESGRFEVEGKIAVLEDARLGEAALSPGLRDKLSYIVESSLSGTFSHPERFLADSPVYDAGRSPRRVGVESLRNDAVDDVKASLAGTTGFAAPNWHIIGDTDICQAPSSLTHLYLSGNAGFTAEGVESLFRVARGYIEHFDSASPALTTGVCMPFEMAGLVGRSHLFRPVFASNLSSLRVHHSLVTQVPTVKHPCKSPLASLEYAETAVRENAELAYPQTFVPNLNPRLQSLTLCCLPRLSAGPLLDKLIQFLALAHEQEDGIKQASATMSHRGPIMLRGLRHIRLEFEPYPPSDDADSGFASLDAEAILNASAGGFSFFEEAGGSRPARDLRHHGADDAVDGTLSAPAQADRNADEPPTMGQSDRLPHYPLPGASAADSEYVCEAISWNEDGAVKTGQLSVWVGSGVLGSNRAVNAYMSSLSRPNLRARIRPATPDQIKAGVSPGACVFNAAWDAILWSDGMPGLKSLPSDGRDMLDVVQVIRNFRRATSAGLTPILDEPLQKPRAIGHWTGKLEVMLA